MPLMPYNRFDKLMEALPSYPDFSLSGWYNPFPVSKQWLANIKENPASADARLYLERREQVEYLHKWLNMSVAERLNIGVKHDTE